MAFGFNLAAIDDHADHLTAVWHLEETGAAVRVDSVGSNDAASAGGSGTIAGISGNALACDEDTDTYLTVTDHADVSPTTGLALSVWFYAEPGLADVSRILVNKANAYGMKFTSTPFFYFPVYQSDTTLKQANGISASEEAWHQLLGIAADSFVRLYLDSAEVATPVAYDNTIKDNAVDLFIDTNVTASDWDGGLDEIALWKNISFADQTAREAFVTGHWNSGTGRFYGELPAAAGPPLGSMALLGAGK